MYEVYLGLGSNLGDREGFIQSAEDLILALKGVKLIGTSSIYLTEPWGNSDQQWFLNKVLCVECSRRWTPFSFLKQMLEIETKLGRQRTIRWGPRNIDIDILIFGDFVIKTKRLTLPHPYITQRAFVLVPLLELNPYLRLPTGEVLKEKLKELSFRVEGNRIYQKFYSSSHNLCGEL